MQAPVQLSRFHVKHKKQMLTRLEENAGEHISSLKKRRPLNIQNPKVMKNTIDLNVFIFYNS